MEKVVNYVERTFIVPTLEKLALAAESVQNLLMQVRIGHTVLFMTLFSIISMKLRIGTTTLKYLFTICTWLQGQIYSALILEAVLLLATEMNHKLAQFILAMTLLIIKGNVKSSSSQTDSH